MFQTIKFDPNIWHQRRLRFLTICASVQPQGMAATRARFEAVELNMTEMQDSINVVLMSGIPLAHYKTRDGQQQQRKGMEESQFVWTGTEDPQVWLDRARQYFGAQDIPTNKRVQWASYHLGGGVGSALDIRGYHGVCSSEGF